MMMYPCLGSCVSKAQVQLVQVETSTLSASMLPLGQVRGVALRLQSENSTHSNNSYKRNRRMEKCKCIKWEDAFCYHVMQEAQKTVDFIVQSLEIQWRNGSHWADLLFIWLSNPVVSDEFRNSWIDLVGLAALGMSLDSGSNIDYEWKHSQPKLAHSSSALLCWTLVQTLWHPTLVLRHRWYDYLWLSTFLWEFSRENLGTLHAWHLRGIAR